VQNVRFYFLAPANPMPVLAGAMTIERYVSHGRWSLLKPADVDVFPRSGAMSASAAVLPVLPVVTLAEIPHPAGEDARINVGNREVAEFPRVSPTGSFRSLPARRTRTPPRPIFDVFELGIEASDRAPDSDHGLAGTASTSPRIVVVAAADGFGRLLLRTAETHGSGLTVVAD
jgi:hypothetical protein